MSPARRLGPEPAGALLLGLFTVAFFHRVFLGEVFIQGDFHQTFVPMRGILGRALRQGLPLWNDWIGNGAPLLANSTAAALYPPNWLFAFLAPAEGLTWLTVVHIFFGSLGAFRLARCWGQAGVSALVAGLTFGFCGLSVSCVSSLTVLVFLPWLLLTAESARTAEPGRLRRALGLAFVVAGMLTCGGEPFYLLSGALGTLLLAGRGRPAFGALRERAWNFFRLAPGLALGFLIAMPHLLAMARYLPSSVRGAGFIPEGALQWSMHPIEPLGLVLSDPFGDPNLSGPQGFWAQGLVAPRSRPYFPGSYVGAVALALAILGSLKGRWQRGPLLVWLFLSLLLALGRHLPLGEAFAAVPGFAAFRYPVKWLAPAMLPVALLAGFGLQDLIAGCGAGAARRSSRASALSVAFGVLALLAVFGLGLTSGLDERMARLALTEPPGGNGAPVRMHPAFVSEVRTQLLVCVAKAATPLLLATLLGFFALRMPSEAETARLLGRGIALLVGLDLLFANRHLISTVKASSYDPPPVVRALLADPGPRGRLWPPDTTAPSRLAKPPRELVDVFRWQRSTLQAYAAVDYGFPLALNDDIEAASPLSYAIFKQLADGAPPRERLMLGGAAGVTHVLSFVELHSPFASEIGRFAEFGQQPVFAYRNHLALPGVRAVGRLLAYRDLSDFRTKVRQGPDDLFARAAFVDSATFARLGNSHEGTAPRLGLVERSPARLVLDTQGAGYVMVAETLAPGWRATLDGKPVEIFAADIAFRGVAIPEGRHRLEMVYRPW